MAERTEIRPYEKLSFRLNSDGSWSFFRESKDGAISDAIGDRAPSFDEAVAMAKKSYSVR